MAYNKKRTTSAKEDRPDPHVHTAEQIIKAMEEAVEWEKDWIVCKTIPYNAITKKPYRSLNAVILMTRGFSDPRIYPAGEVKKLYEETKGEVRIQKGQKASYIYVPIFDKVETDRIDPETGKKETVDKLRNWLYRPVYHAGQLHGIEPLPEAVLNPKFEDHAAAELIVEAMKAKTGLTVNHLAQGRAYYSPGEHAVVMPTKEQFKSMEGYYSTLFHESCGHGTGHPSILNRDQTGRMKGNKSEVESYAFEELIAEITAVQVSAEVGLSYDRKTHDNSMAYLKSWIKALRNDPEFIFKACKSAGEATNKVIAFRDEYKLELAQSVQRDNKLELGMDMSQVVKKRQPEMALSM